MNAETAALAAHFANAPAIFTTSPLYQRLCEVVAADQPILELLTERRTGQQASYLFFGAVQDLLLDDAIGDGGPLYHVWIEPPAAPHHPYQADPRGVLAMHGPEGGNPSALVKVDGHLHWLAAL